MPGRKSLLTFARANLIFLLLCSAVLSDGPTYSIWHVSGHGHQWQQAQLDAGLPLEPSVQLPSYFEQAPDKQAYVDKLNLDAPILSQWSGRPIALRMNNILREIDYTLPRISPLTEETWRQSHMCVRRLPAGSLDATTTVCPFAGTAAFSECGRRWATSIWLQRLQQIIPAPTGVIFRQNNEGGRLAFKSLYDADRPRYRKANGSLANAELATPPSQYVDATGAPLTLDWIVYLGSDNKLQMERWKPDATLDTIDLRAKEWIAPRRGTRPSLSLGDFTALENAQYRALYAAFDANLSAAWQGKLRTCGYGGWDENRQSDTASPAMYHGYYRDADITVPGQYAVNRWDSGEELANEAANPKAWREYSIAVGNPANAIYAPLVAGRHAMVDPQSFAGLMTHVAWRMQAPGREVRLVQWDNNAVKPTHLIFSTGTNSTTLKQAHIDALTALDRTDLLNVTIGDYELAVMQALGRIHADPVINEYWKRGTTRLLASPLNTSTATKVFATETTIPGVSAKLIYCYTPCDLDGLIEVEGTLLPARRSGYYLNGSAVEIE